MSQVRGFSSIDPANSPTLLTSDTGGPRTIANPLYVDPRTKTYVTGPGTTAAKWAPGQYKSVQEFMAARPAGDMFQGNVDQGAAEHGQTVGKTYFANAQLAADNAAWAKYGTDNGFFPKDGGLSWGLRDAFLNPAVLAAVGGYFFAPAGGATAGESAAGGASAGGAASAGGSAQALTADQLLAQSAAGLSETGLAETASVLGAGEASAIGAGAGTAATGTGGGTGGSGSAGIGAGTEAGNTAAAAPAPGGTSTAAKAIATAKAIGEYGSAAMTIGSLISGGSGGVDMPSPDAPAPMQPAKDPDYAGIRQKVPGGLSSGNLSTLLTGASGIDPSTLMLGKSLLLGS